jgi:hypothetical protein
MKKLSLIPLTAVTALVLFASCSKRDHNCTCQYTDLGGVPVKTVTTVSGTLTKARNACKSHEATLKYYAQSNVDCMFQ